MAHQRPLAPQRPRLRLRRRRRQGRTSAYRVFSVQGARRRHRKESPAPRDRKRGARPHHEGFWRGAASPVQCSPRFTVRSRPNRQHDLRSAALQPDLLPRPCKRDKARAPAEVQAGCDGPRLRGVSEAVSPRVLAPRRRTLSVRPIRRLFPSLYPSRSRPPMMCSAARSAPNRNCYVGQSFKGHGLSIQPGRHGLARHVAADQDVRHLALKKGPPRSERTSCDGQTNGKNPA
jgi:hypothetical protein